MTLIQQKGELRTKFEDTGKKLAEQNNEIKKLQDKLKQSLQKPETADYGTQLEKLPTTERGTQSEKLPSTEQGTQSEKLPSRDYRTQANEKLPSRDYGTQSENLPSRDYGTQANDNLEVIKGAVNNLIQLTELTEKYNQAQETLQEQRLRLEEREKESMQSSLRINSLETQVGMEKYEARQLGKTDVQNKREIQEREQEIQNLKKDLQQNEKAFKTVLLRMKEQEEFLLGKGAEIIELENEYKKQLIYMCIYVWFIKRLTCSYNN